MISSRNKFSVLGLALLWLGGSGCHRSSSTAADTGAADAMPTPPTVDELGYFERLKARRPDLLKSDDSCYLTLVVKPKYRASVLDENANYDSIVATRYTAQQRADDLGWLAGHEDAEVQFCKEHPGAGGCDRICSQACPTCPDAASIGSSPGTSLSVHPSGYPLCSFVGYSTLTGLRGGERYDATGVVDAWKVFLEFRDDFASTLTPARYLEFSNRLAAAGFRGDSKLFTNPSAPERFRFQYNNVIVHAHSPADAKIAEKVGIEFFGAALEGRGRGVDVGEGAALLDWHHFLCAQAGDLSRLSGEARDFVHFHD